LLYDLGQGDYKIDHRDRLVKRSETRSQNGKILLEQLRILFSYIVPSVASSLIVMLAYIWVYNDLFTSNAQYYWVSVMVLISLARISLYLFVSKNDHAINPRKYLYIYAFLMFLSGCIWGAMVYIPIEVVDNQFMILTVLVLGLACISTISSSAHPLVSGSFLLPIAILVAQYLIYTSEEEYKYIIVIGTVAFCAAAGLTSHSIHKMIVNALNLQTSNVSLMDGVVEIAKQNQKSYEGYQTLLDNLGAGAAMFDKNNKVISWNKSFENIFNIPAGLIKKGMTLKELTRKVIKQSWQNNIDVNHAADEHIREILSEVDDNNMVKLVLADGRNLYCRVMRINDDQLILNYTDVTSLEQARKDDVIHVLQHDSLTGLPNKVLHKKEVKQRVDEYNRILQNPEDDKTKHFMGLIHFGLNSLDEIYDYLGLNAGDMVVAEIAERCKKFIAEGVHLSHVRYDEFHIITQAEEDLDQILSMIERLAQIISEPIDVNGNSVTVTVSVGISIYPEHTEQAEILTRNAKIAFNKAKIPNEENIIIYDHGMHSEIMQRSNLLFDIRDSIKKSEFLLHYQPQIDLKTKQIAGVEALLRWHHPEKGWIEPDAFIPLAEHTKQIIPLTEQFLPEACYQAKKWQVMGLPPVKMSVNISPSHFHDKGFTKFIQKSLDDAQLEPEYLELEITEGVIMSQTEDIIKILHDLSQMGVQLSIDDFGTGYSSLSYLRSLPVDKLKIDQAFITDMSKDKSALSLVEAIIRLGHSFNLNVIAEGVETEEQLNKLCAMNCDQAQGYFIKRPEKAEDISEWLKSYKI
jgi:diguanylate cyclase (GGDEF)-like protein